LGEMKKKDLGNPSKQWPPRRKGRKTLDQGKGDGRGECSSPKNVETEKKLGPQSKAKEKEKASRPERPAGRKW